MAVNDSYKVHHMAVIYIVTVPCLLKSQVHNIDKSENVHLSDLITGNKTPHIILKTTQ